MGATPMTSLKSFGRPRFFFGCLVSASCAAPTRRAQNSGACCAMSRHAAHSPGDSNAHPLLGLCNLCHALLLLLSPQPLQLFGHHFIVQFLDRPRAVLRANGLHRLPMVLQWVLLAQAHKAVGAGRHGFAAWGARAPVHKFENPENGRGGDCVSNQSQASEDQ